jgi:hypothetical protein
MKSAKNLGEMMPIYITRKNSEGDTGTLSASIWMVLLVVLLVWSNVVVWGVVGLIQGFKVFF